MHKLIAGLTLVSVMFVATSIVAETAEEKGFAIAARSDRTDLGFGDSIVQMQMILHNSAGQMAKRTLTLKTLEKPNEQVGDKSIIIFDTPVDINGTALLSHAKILKADDQWLYLPALKRIKRISSANKSGPFVGSEFAFEDFTSLELNKFSYKYIASEKCNNMLCDIVQRIPRYEYSGYTRQLSWVDQTDYQVRKVEFYDRRGDLIKTLALDEYRKYKGMYWRAHKLTMINHQTKKQTELVYSEYKFSNGLSNNAFNKAVLKRIR